MNAAREVLATLIAFGAAPTPVTESLDSELRTFLTNSRAIVARGIHCCAEAIAVLDRDRELRGGRLDDAPSTAH